MHGKRSWLCETETYHFIPCFLEQYFSRLQKTVTTKVYWRAHVGLSASVHHLFGGLSSAVRTFTNVCVQEKVEHSGLHVSFVWPVLWLTGPVVQTLSASRSSQHQLDRLFFVVWGEKKKQKQKQKQKHMKYVGEACCGCRPLKVFTMKNQPSVQSSWACCAELQEIACAESQLLRGW